MNFIVTADGLSALDFEGACRHGEVDPTPWVSPGYWPAVATISPDRPHVNDDLYSLGVTIWHIFSGTIPGGVRPPALATLRYDLPEAIAETVERLLGDDPWRRPDANAVVGHLKANRSGRDG
jgi:hypothetical protein